MYLLGWWSLCGRQFTVPFENGPETTCTLLAGEEPERVARALLRKDRPEGHRGPIVFPDVGIA